MTALPRCKPVPKHKDETKWEVFAKSKGIQKKKKGRMVWDDSENQWAPSWGYKRRDKESADEPIVSMPRSNPRSLRELIPPSGAD